MFSDRWWIAKALAAVAALGWLGQDARRAYADLIPDVARLPFEWELLRDRSIHLQAQRVEASRPGGFEIETRAGPIRVEWPTPPPAGEYVSLNARPTGPRTLRALDLQVNAGYRWKRPLNYGISLLTVVGYLWLVRGRFRWRAAEGMVRSRY